MQTLVVCQNKGGDGKTMLSRLIGEFAGRNGLSTLLIDMDPQCNLSQRFIRMDIDQADPDGVMPPVHPEFDPEDAWDGRCSIADIYGTRAAEYGIAPYETWAENVQILPGHGSAMRAVELVRSSDVRELVVERLRAFLSDPAFRSFGYDLVVIDTPPSKGPLVQSAIRAADHMVIPCQMEQGSVEGLQGMLQQWRRENQNRPLEQRLNLLGILPNKFRAVLIQQGTLEALLSRVAIRNYVLPMRIALRSVFAEVDHPNAKPRSVFDLPASNPARQEAESVCRHVLREMRLIARADHATADEEAAA